MSPNTRDPMAVYEDREQAIRDAFNVYAPIAKRAGYRVRVRRTTPVRPGSSFYGIYLVPATRRTRANASH